MYSIATYENPKGRTPTPLAVQAVGNKRDAIRKARRDLRSLWHSRGPHTTVVRVAVRDDAKKLLYQARIDEDTAQNGYRRMIKDEEL